MRDDPLKNLSVVQAVQQVPQLYLPDGSNGLSKKEREQLWDSVGEKCDISGTAARDRWRIVRGCYLRYIKGLEASGPMKKEYYLAKYMEFVRPYLYSRTSTLPSTPAKTPSKAVVKHSPRSTRKRKHEVSVEEEEPKVAEEECVTEEEEDPTPTVETSVKLQTPKTQQSIVIQDVAGVDSEYLVCAVEEEKKATTENVAEATYTLRNGQLVDTTITVPPKTPQSSVLVPSNGNVTTQYHPVQSLLVQPEDIDPDLLFFKSLLPQMSNWTIKQKNKFKLRVLTALDEIDDG